MKFIGRGDPRRPVCSFDVVFLKDRKSPRADTARGVLFIDIKARCNLLNIDVLTFCKEAYSFYYLINVA